MVPVRNKRMCELAADGLSATAIAEKVGCSANHVMAVVRKFVPHAFRKGSGANEYVRPKSQVARTMPHNGGWSTAPVGSHTVTLPRLRCLERVA